jgi:hypothetical protein
MPAGVRSGTDHASALGSRRLRTERSAPIESGEIPNVTLRDRILDRCDEKIPEPR